MEVETFLHLKYGTIRLKSVIGRRHSLINAQRANKVLQCVGDMVGLSLENKYSSESCNTCILI